MLNPRQQKYADRIRELIDMTTIGKVQASQYKAFDGLFYVEAEDSHTFFEWTTNVQNVLASCFGRHSDIYKRFESLLPNGADRTTPHIVGTATLGLLRGALSDLENGYLTSQQFLIAADVFDGVLEQARHLNDTGYKDPAAVLVRVVVEDALKRLAADEGIDITGKKATTLNDDLHKADRYNKIQWRQIQVWLDLGNAAAHGQWDKFSKEDVERTIPQVETFLASHFS